MDRGLFRPESVKRIFAEHRSKTRDRGNQIWRLINLEVWQRVAIDGESSEDVAAQAQLTNSGADLGSNSIRQIVGSVSAAPITNVALPQWAGDLRARRAMDRVERTACHQSSQKRIPVVAAQRCIVERGDKTSGASHQRGTRRNVPFILRRERECDVGQARRIRVPVCMRPNPSDESDNHRSGIAATRRV